MPIGATRRGTATGPVIVPATLGDNLTRPGYGPDDTWEHYEIAAGQLAGGAVVDIQTPPAQRIVILERDGVQLFIAFDKIATATIYDLIHPGAGELDRSYPLFHRFTMVASANPTNIVDVWVLGGRFGVTPT